MRFVRLLMLLLLLAAPAAKAALETGSYVAPTSINVLAVSSLAPALTELARIYSAKENTSVIFVFDSPYALAARIDGGEASDVFIADHPKWLEALKQKGLIDVYSSHPIGSNQLVLAFPKTSLLLQRMPTTGDVRAAIDWLSTRTLFVIGDSETTSLGLYAEQALKTMGLWNRVRTRAIRASGNQQAVLQTAGSPAAGILYASDLTTAPHLVQIAAFPAGTSDAIVYTAAAVAGENMPAARSFIDFLGTAEARAILRKHGITP